MTGGQRSIYEWLRWGLYALAVALSVSVWFIAVRAPLWLDETISVWQINAGFHGILIRQGGLSFPAYSYILWLFTVVLGKSEIALRIPEILAMLAAVYLLYLAARELFDRDVAIIAAVVFCLHPVVVFAAIDVRPYAFGALAINAAILCLVRLRHNSSNWLPALFGLSAAFIVYFHFLFAVILPALVIGFFAIKVGDRKILWRQAGVALAVFALAFVPVIPGLYYMFHTRGEHPYSVAPGWLELLLTLAPGWLALVLFGILLALAALPRTDSQGHLAAWRTWFCLSLALVPILILFAVSVATPMHVFVPRYRLIAVPGIALSWGLVANRIGSRALSMAFLVAIVAVGVYQHVSAPASKRHSYTWKYALEAVDKNAAADGAPVLVCSDLPESNYVAMPPGSAKDSTYFAPLVYYRVSVPVVPLPRALNEQARRTASEFLQDAARRRQRFLAVAFTPSYNTLDWIAERARDTHEVHNLGVFDGVKILEFTPRIQQAPATR
jgi:hypothetical protein